MPSAAQHMIEYIERELIRRLETRIEPTTPLVSSGLVDSLALVDVLLKLEQLTNVRIPPGKVQAKDMDTVEKMFETAARVGKSR